MSILGFFLVRIQSELGKTRTRKTPNTDTFHAVSMTVLIYDDAIKNSRDFDYYFGIFWKILCIATVTQSFIARALMVQDL